MSKTIPYLDEQMLSWFRQYGSHVILHRAVPHIADGLKPSQRRVLHSLHELEDGRYNKVANTVGNTLKYHPHGDASVFETLVGLGQKGYLIDTQGNWGNILTGDGAAAARYIEARLSPLAKECLFNPKTTEWQDSYDGRNKEPVCLPSKLPLLLIQGTEGIAVSLACKILPHNLAECCQAAIDHLLGEDFSLIPDFHTGGSIDCSNYKEGEPGGKVKIRAKIEEEKDTLIITEIPYGTTTGSIRDSIVKAEERGAMRIKRIHDMTAECARVVVEFPPGTDLENARAALYSFTECEVSHTVNAAVIQNGHPVFLGTKALLRDSAERARDLIKWELEIELKELDDLWHKLSLEKVFIETGAYKEIETAETEEEAVKKIREAMKVGLVGLRRQPTDEDMCKLTELKFRRAARYDSRKAEKDILNVEVKERVAKKKLGNLTETTINHFAEVLSKYGKDGLRRTEISLGSFTRIAAAEVAATDMKIFWDPENGFIGTSLKKDIQLPFEVNPMTDVAAISDAGVLRISRPGQKTFYAEHLLDARPVDKSGEDIYNMVYTDKESGTTYAKRFKSGGGFTRERNYPLAGGSETNKVWFLSVTREKEPAPKMKLTLAANCGARKKEMEFDLGTLAPKGRESQGNTITKYEIASVKQYQK